MVLGDRAGRRLCGGRPHKDNIVRVQLATDVFQAAKVLLMAVPVLVLIFVLVAILVIVLALHALFLIVLVLQIHSSLKPTHQIFHLELSRPSYRFSHRISVWHKNMVHTHRFMQVLKGVSKLMLTSCLTVACALLPCVVAATRKRSGAGRHNCFQSLFLSTETHLQAINRTVLKDDGVAVVIQNLVQRLIQRLLIALKDDLHLGRQLLYSVRVRQRNARISQSLAWQLSVDSHQIMHGS